MVDGPEPFPTNPTASVVNQAIDGVFNVAAKMADAAIFTAAPFLADPVLSELTEEAVQLIANAVYKQFATFVTFEIIDFQSGVEASDQQKALTALKVAQKSGDQNAIQTALTAFAKSCESLTHLDGASQP